MVVNHLLSGMHPQEWLYHGTHLDASQNGSSQLSLASSGWYILALATERGIPGKFSSSSLALECASFGAKLLVEFFVYIYIYTILKGDTPN